MILYDQEGMTRFVQMTRFFISYLLITSLGNHKYMVKLGNLFNGGNPSSNLITMHDLTTASEDVSAQRQELMCQEHTSLTLA